MVDPVAGNAAATIGLDQSNAEHPQAMAGDRVRPGAEASRRRRRQYDAAIESLDAALHVSDAGTPEELRRRTEQFCRKTLDCMREVTETQIREFQEAVTKWTDLFAKAGP